MPVRSSDSGERSHTPWRRKFLVAVGLMVVITADPTASFAHDRTDNSGFSNYQSTVTSISPAVPGLQVTTFGVNGGLELVNRSDQDVVVRGYDNEPFLRINSTGVFANLNSPATYLNLRSDANVPVPTKATSSTTVNWYQISYGDTVLWHDHRTRWMGSAAPDGVRTDPSSRQVVIPAWQVAILVNEQPAAITGRLEWVPPPRRAAWLGISFVIFLGAVLIMQMFRSTRSLTALALLGALVANVTVAVSRATSQNAVGMRRLTCFIAGGVALVLFAIGVFSRKRTGPPIMWSLAGAVLVGSAIAYLKVFLYSSVDGSATPESMRWAIAVELAASLAVFVHTLVCAFELRMAQRAVDIEIARVHQRDLIAEPDPELTPNPASTD